MLVVVVRAASCVGCSDFFEFWPTGAQKPSCRLGLQHSYEATASDDAGDARAGKALKVSGRWANDAGDAQKNTRQPQATDDSSNSLGQC